MPSSITDIANELFFEQPSGTLFHYTSLKGLRGIIDSGFLHVSDIRYFNDTSEIDTAFNLLSDAVFHRRMDVDRTDMVERFKVLRLTQFVDGLRTHVLRSAGVYVGSFTMNGNLLSQWRGYCPGMKGVSIGFSADHLREAADRQHFSIGKCIYDARRQAEIGEAIIGELASRLNRRKSTPAQDSGLDYLQEVDHHALSKDIIFDLQRIVVLLKHSKFMEEDEWRIVSPMRRDTGDPTVYFREGKAMLIPYLKFELPSSPYKRVELETVYLGPSQHPSTSKMSLTHYLASARAFPRHGVQYCDIPLRES